MADDMPRDPQPDDSVWQRPTPPYGGPSGQRDYPTRPYSYPSAWGPPTDPAAGRAAPPARQRPRRGLGLAAVLIFVAGVIAGAIGGAVGTNIAADSETVTLGGSTANGQPAISAPPGSVAAVAQQVLPSVVQMKVRGSGTLSEGSGVILTKDGYILTNNHVVEPAVGGGEITAVLRSGREVPARIVGRNPVADIAVVRARGVSGLNPAELGSSENLVVGQRVLAVGSPLGLSGTVTSGIISALNRAVSTGEPGTQEFNTINAIQTDAPINPGNSGGPLVNMKGRVIGINTAIASLHGGLGGKAGSIGLGFAIPIDTAKRIAKSLIEDGISRKAVLGVRIPSGEAPQGAGALITKVVPGSAAAAAGLEPGDVVIRVDDRRINSGNGLVAAIHSKRPGERIELTVRHPDGSTRTLPVKLGSKVVRPGG